MKMKEVVVVSLITTSLDKNGSKETPNAIFVFHGIINFAEEKKNLY